MRILLVEDEPRAAQMLARGLREQTYAVDVTGDGDEALYHASITDYDAVILDVMLPQRDGFSVCQQLRASGSTVPVLMLTARESNRASRVWTSAPTITSPSHSTSASCSPACAR
jgi:two-component system, OmpR family, response regulator